MRAALVAIAVMAVWACGKGDASGTPAVAPRTAADSADVDATTLGREIYHLLDLAADYRGSHRGRLPRSLRDLGTDSLTTDIARSISTTSGFSASAAFRNPVGHAWVSCEGQLKVLEDAVLGAGRYTLTCVSSAGEPHAVQAGGALD